MITNVGAQTFLLWEKVVAVEHKVNYLRPAKGERLVATATAESSGSRQAVCRCEAVAVEAGKGRRCAVGQGTIVLLS